MSDLKRVHGGVVAPKGFRCAGVSCGIKTAVGAPDIGLIVSDVPARAAAVFSRNRVASHTKAVNRARLRRALHRGIVVNAGNANTCTGPGGLTDARRMAALAGECTGAGPRDFLVASTGIIGRPLPMPKVEAGIVAAAVALGRTRRHGADFARAIMTTDTVPKSCAVEIRVGRTPVRIGGAAKGAGMIAPNMATMLAFVATDASVAKPMLQRLLSEAADLTFNRLTVDGDCSTNDTLSVFANGAAGNAPITKAGASCNAFRRGLLAVCETLVKALAADGEGATKRIEVRVTGGRSRSEADRVARAIANSPLVKTAVHGCDPNWGRIVCAAGYSGAAVEPGKMKLRINGTVLFRDGVPCRVRPDRLAMCMRPRDVVIALDLGRGKHEARMWTCDFSTEYVTINADYHT